MVTFERILYAPGVHTGGGLVLLGAVLASWRTDTPSAALLDLRARELLDVPQGVNVTWIAPSPLSRLGGEIRLREVASELSTVLSFHGLPPLFRIRGKVILFLQNRLHLDARPLSNFSARTRLRIGIERKMMRIFSQRVFTYFVQTDSMRRALQDWQGGESTTPSVPVSVIPFLPEIPPTSGNAHLCKVSDFLYVADGQPHKNHRRLLAAWELLASDGVRPSLSVTLGPRDNILWDELFERASRSDLVIRNLGHLSHSEILSSYRSAGALIFPSITESFGIPLIEASKFGLPIIASELDFVRDVCTPAETFDPLSAVSIARAVRRHLGCSASSTTLHSPAEFLEAVFGSGPK